MTNAYRLCKNKWKADSGAGAALHGGRWNPVGAEVIYASSSMRSAFLERIVHFTAGGLPDDDALTEIHIPDTVRIEYVSDDSCRQIGTPWLIIPSLKHLAADGAELRSCVLSVPSSIVRTERTSSSILPTRILLAIEFLPPQPFSFDPRLKR